MSESVKRLSERLQAEGQKTLEFFGSLLPSQWEITLYEEGSCWTVKQVLAHFVASEAAFGALIGNVAKGGPGSPEEFDINLFNERKVSQLQGNTPEELADQYIELRQENVALVSSLIDGDLSRTGRHPFLGVAPLEEIIKLLYRHNQIHQRDVRKALAQRDGEDLHSLQ